jgi:hypothetical protein
LQHRCSALTQLLLPLLLLLALLPLVVVAVMACPGHPAPQWVHL